MQQTFNHRLNGLKEMAIKSTLTGYDDTYEFAKELGQHYKIFGIYATSNIEGAYSIGRAIIDNNGTTIKFTSIKNIKNLNLVNDDKLDWANPIAIVTTDRTPFLFSCFNNLN